MRIRGPQSVLFVCSLNAGRSQMAAALFNQLANPTRATAVSAGLNPAPCVHPEVVVVMREIGIDLADVVPTELTARMQTEISFLVTLGCGETCPLIPIGRRADWKLPDPEGRPLSEIRAIRDDIKALVEDLIFEREWGRRGTV